jgi:cold shock CspA family protein
MRHGTVKNISERGFGFISELAGPDLFFHCSSLIDLEFDEQLIGRRVQFEVVPDVKSKKGPKAVNVKAAN